MSGWIPKSEAIGMVHAASRAESRSSARTTLGGLVSRGVVRTKSGDRPAWAKHPSKLYRRADIKRWIAARDRARVPEWRPDEDALLGTDHDPVIAKKIGRPVHQVCDRRRALGIVPRQGGGGGRCEPTSWRWPVGHPRLEPPVSQHG